MFLVLTSSNNKVHFIAKSLNCNKIAVKAVGRTRMRVKPIAQRVLPCTLIEVIRGAGMIALLNQRQVI